ncbi:hypothetical protein C8R44DRAFT_806431 [Mycena epipterygia]|nr:hypothetical protein C8R44DRAFT_806431 [Mycena epipterygia]
MSSSTPNGPSSRTSRGKRTRDDVSPAPPPTKNKRAKGMAPASSKKKQRGDKFHLKRGDVEDADKSLQSTMVQHIRLLWGLYSSNSLPSPPAETAMDHFEQNFGTAEEIDEFISTLKYKHKDAKKRIRLFRNDPQTIHSRSLITRNIVAMSDEDLDTIYSAVIVSGIINWNPDVLGSPDSMYNIAHERVAIRTFQVVCAAHGYSRLGPNLTNLMDRVLLTGFYRNFVFSYILKLVKAEMKEPGRLDVMIANKNTYSRRTRLADGRTVYILESGYPKAPGTKQVIAYLRKKKNARSTKVETWIHGTVDLGRIKRIQALGLAAQVKEERIRTADPNDITGSEISQRLPVPGVPLDWFDPEYFNAMPAAMRHTYAKKGAIALPLEEHLMKKDWKNMDEATFMKKYGNDVLALYDLPTAEEMAQVNKNLQSDDEDDALDDDEEGSEDDMEQDE